MTTCRDAAALVGALYGRPGYPPVDWLYRSGEYASCYIGVTVLGGFLAVVPRGSFNLRDWLHDAQAVAQEPLDHPQLGPVHHGFYSGVEDAWAVASSFLLRTELPLLLAGHSLGAAHADYLAALALLAKVPVAGLLRWGEPKPGFQKLADLLARVPWAKSWQNGDDRHHDLVTEVPLSLPPENYVHPHALTRVTAAPTPSMYSDWDAFAWHNFDLYYSATPTTELA